MNAPTSLLEAGIPLHMGNLHPFEQAIVAVLAFGPVLLLAATVFIVRRRDAREDDDTRPDETR